MILLKGEIGAGGKNFRPFCGLFNGPSDDPTLAVRGLCP
jgi:hypothetical protein